MSICPSRPQIPSQTPARESNGYEDSERGGMRRTLRSAAVMPRSRRNALAIPDSLPVDGIIDASSAKLFKREHEDGAYASLRSTRSGPTVLVQELRDEWQRLLLPSRGCAHSEGRESAALFAGGADVPEVPPLYLGACCNSEAAQRLLQRELASIIAKGDWQELWVLLGQIADCIEKLVRADFVRPWWVRQAQEFRGSADVAEQIDLVEREAPGGVDAPVDVTGAIEPVVKLEVRPEVGVVHFLEARAKRMRDAEYTGVRLVDGKPTIRGKRVRRWKGGWLEQREEQQDTNEEAPFTALCDAIELGTVDDVKYLLAQGADPGAPNEEKEIYFGDYQGFKDAYPNAYEGAPPIMAAIGAKRPGSERFEIVRALLDAGAEADMNYDSEGSCTVLEYATRQAIKVKGSLDESFGVKIVELIGQNGGNNSFWGGEEGQPIQMAAEAGHVDLVRALLEGTENADGIYPSTSECTGTAPIEYAIDYAMNQHDWSMVLLLAKHGAQKHGLLEAIHLAHESDEFDVATQIVNYIAKSMGRDPNSL